MLVVFDLDDTLADTRHRRHLIIPPGEDYVKYDARHPSGTFKPDWDAFFAARYGDTPIEPAVHLFHALVKAGHDVEIWTAARKSSREITEKWLVDKCAIAPAHLTFMRQAEDWRKSADLKESWVLQKMPALAFDDHKGVCEMMRKHGIYVGCVGDATY